MKRSSVAFLVATLFALSAPAGNVHGHADGKYIAHYARMPVAVDGKWTGPDEWSDAVEVELPPGLGEQSKAVFRAKHDEKKLYLLIEFLSDTTIDYHMPGESEGAYRQDQITFFFDVGDRGGSALGPNDCFVSTMWASEAGLSNMAACAAQGNWPDRPELDPPDVRTASTLDPANSPYGWKHLIWEMEIPKRQGSVYDFTHASALGFSIVVYDNGKRVAAVLPQVRSNTTPSTWADMELAWEGNPSPGSHSETTQTSIGSSFLEDGTNRSSSTAQPAVTLTTPMQVSQEPTSVLAGSTQYMIGVIALIILAAFVHFRRKKHPTKS